MNNEKGDSYNYAYAQLLCRTHRSCSLVVDNVLYIAMFTFFTPFVKHRFVSCSLTYTLINPPILYIMERVSLKAYLCVLICVLIADLTALSLLRWQLICLVSKSKLLRQPRTWIMILKRASISALLSLLALHTSKGVAYGKRRIVQLSRIL